MEPTDTPTNPTPDAAVRSSKWAKQIPAKTGHKPQVSKLPETVRFAIRFEYLSAPDTTMEQLGAKYGLSKYQVSRVLDGPEYQAMRDSLNATQVQQAQDKLASMRDHAVQGWYKAIPIAAKQGKHQPARDLLLATGVIQDQKPPATVSVQIGIAGDGVNIGAKVQVVVGSPVSSPSYLPPSQLATVPPALPLPPED